MIFKWRALPQRKTLPTSKQGKTTLPFHGELAGYHRCAKRADHTLAQGIKNQIAPQHSKKIDSCEHTRRFDFRRWLDILSAQHFERYMSFECILHQLRKILAKMRRQLLRYTQGAHSLPKTLWNLAAYPFWSDCIVYDCELQIKGPSKCRFSPVWHGRRM